MEALGVDVETTIYDDAGHGFCNNGLSTFSSRAAQSAWLTAMNFLSGTVADAPRGR